MDAVYGQNHSVVLNFATQPCWLFGDAKNQTQDSELLFRNFIGDSMMRTCQVRATARVGESSMISSFHFLFHYPCITPMSLYKPFRGRG